MFTYKGRAAVVTGGSSGIGLGIAEALADKGMNIVIVGRNAAKAEVAAERIRAKGVNALAVPMDVADREATFALAKRVEEELGGVEVLVLNAGVTTAGQLVDHIPEDWDWVFDTLIGGPANGLQAFLPGLIEQGHGHIVITASMVGLVPDYFLHHGPYAAAKSGIIGLVTALRPELEGTGVGVSALIPAGVDTALMDSHSGRPGVQLGALPAEKAPHPMGSIMPRDDAPDLLRASEFISPEYVGRRVIDGIDKNHHFIITHPEFRPAFEEYSKRILEAFDYGMDHEKGLGRTAVESPGSNEETKAPM
ncbi:SDR family NAD(P)-dependent oxidoreductase [Paenarthrobacter aurescens]|uniref:SDR family NAD(P)-dependent oxidoreductase n=1 Tax=Paenarthrobacter aurescens TaxID=43663 RepID=UPI0035EFA87F